MRRPCKDICVARRSRGPKSGALHGTHLARGHIVSSRAFPAGHTQGRDLAPKELGGAGAVNIERVDTRATGHVLRNMARWAAVAHGRQHVRLFRFLRLPVHRFVVSVALASRAPLDYVVRAPSIIRDMASLLPLWIMLFVGCVPPHTIPVACPSPKVCSCATRGLLSNVRRFGGALAAVWQRIGRRTGAQASPKLLSLVEQLLLEPRSGRNSNKLGPCPMLAKNRKRSPMLAVVRPTWAQIGQHVAKSRQCCSTFAHHLAKFGQVLATCSQFFGRRSHFTNAHVGQLILR